MMISGWGRFPKKDARITPMPHSSQSTELSALLDTGSVIARGLGRSYGDSALADTCIDSTHYNHYISFDESSGLLTCTSGVTLKDIIDTFLPRGWFLAVVPGTQYVTVGGAIASDVHGKNHHRDGCFSRYVKQIELCLDNDHHILCSEEENTELFHATCGGMGLTGIIRSASIQLRRVDSAFIDETVVKTRDLTETIERFEEHASSTYSVAWIDCLAQRQKLGRSIISLGEHSANESLNHPQQRQLHTPFDFPNFALNKFSIKCFNELYYHKAPSRDITRQQPLKSYFFPLDTVTDWNRIYGTRGFCQFQCAVPKAEGAQAIKKLLSVISNNQSASFLAVLKSLGAANHNPLSFPLEGYTLALDFSATPENIKLLQQLNTMTADLGGRVYLTKDSTLSPELFQKMYPRYTDVEKLRKTHQIKYSSLQSRRLEIT